MFAGIRPFILFWLTGFAALAATSVSYAQDESEDRAPPTVIGKIRSQSTPKPRSTTPSAPTENKGGLIQQFKSFTGSLLKPDDSNEPQALEARNRRFPEPATRRNATRNQAAVQRGMPTPPRMDPPSFEKDQPLPPIISSETMRSTTTPSKPSSIDSEFNSQQPSINASTKSSTRRQSEPTKLPDTTSTDTLGSGRNLPTYNGPAARPDTLANEVPTSSPDFAVKRKPLPSASSQTKPMEDRSTATSSTGRRVSTTTSQPDQAPQPPESRVEATPMTRSPSLTLEAPKYENALMQSSLPHIDVIVEGPESLQVNQPTHYQIVAFNGDQIPLNGMIVRLGIPNSINVVNQPTTGNSISVEPEEDGSKSILWQLENLASGQKQTVGFDLQATRPEHFAIDLEWTALPQTGQSKMAVNQPQLQLAIEGPSEVTYGKAEIYRLRLKNPGNADVKDVKVSLRSDPESGSGTTIGDIVAGGERVVEVELTFQQAGNITISAEAASDAMQLRTESAIQIFVKQASLNAIWSLPPRHYIHTVESYELSIENTSSMAAQKIACEVHLPKGCYPISVPEGFQVKGDRIQWRIENIHPGAKVQYPIQLEMAETGMLPLHFECDGAAGATTIADAKANVEAISDLKLTVIDPVAPAPIGKPVTYELVIVNRGSKPATGVKILAQFSNGIEPTEAEGHKHHIVPGQVVFEPIVSIEPGQERKILITAMASEAGAHRFRAEVTSDDTDSQVIHEESTRYLATGRIEAQNGKLRR